MCWRVLTDIERLKPYLETTYSISQKRPILRPFKKKNSDNPSQKLEWQSDSWEWWNVSFTPAIRSNKKQVHEWLFDQFFVNCNLKTLSKKWEKSLKLMHLHENVSLDTTLWLFQKCIKRLEKTVLSNGPHLGSPQYA